jgi:hypothetical protein
MKAKTINQQDANTEFWLDYNDTAFDDVYYGRDEYCSVEFKLCPLNSGTKLVIHGIHQKDMHGSGTFEDSYLKLYDQKDSTDHWGKSIGIFNLGDISFETLVKFAVSILMVYAPDIINKAEMIRLLDIKEDK